MRLRCRRVRRGLVRWLLHLNSRTASCAVLGGGPKDHGKESKIAEKRKETQGGQKARKEDHPEAGRNFDPPFPLWILRADSPDSPAAQHKDPVYSQHSLQPYVELFNLRCS